MWQQISPTPLPTPPQTVTGVFGKLQANILDAVPHLITGAMILAIFLIVAWIGQRIIAYAAPRVHADTGVVLLLSRVYYYSVIVFGLITGLETAGLNVSALIAGLGLTGFALGFALKDVLSNLVAGLMLLMYRPFHIGDQIKMGEFEGTIKTIRMRDTVVRSYDGRLIIIPNTKLITEVVINNTMAKLSRESIAVNIPVDAQTDVAREIFARAMTEHPALKGRAEPRVNISKPDDHSIQLEGRYWCNPHKIDRAAVKEEVTRAVTNALNEAGIHATVQPTLLAPLRQTDTETREDDTEMENFLSKLVREEADYPNVTGDR